MSNSNIVLSTQTKLIQLAKEDVSRFPVDVQRCLRELTPEEQSLYDKLPKPNRGEVYAEAEACNCTTARADEAEV